MEKSSVIAEKQEDSVNITDKGFKGMSEKENRESLKYRKYRNKVGSMRLSALFLHKLKFCLLDGRDILDDEYEGYSLDT